MKRDFLQGPLWADEAAFRRKISELTDTPGVDFGTAEAFAVGVIEIDGEHVLYAPEVVFDAEEPIGKPSCHLVGRRILRPFGQTLGVVGSLPGERGVAGTWRRLCAHNGEVRRVFLTDSLYDSMVMETFIAHDPETCIFAASHEPGLDDLVFLSKIPQGADFTLVFRGWRMARPWVTSWAKLARRAAENVHIKTYEHKTLLGEILTKGDKI